MRQDGEGIPLLQGRPPTGEPLKEGAGGFQQPVPHVGQQDDDVEGCFVTREQSALPFRVTWRPLLLRVLGAAVLIVIAVGLIMSTPGQRRRAQGRGTHLGVSAPTHGDSTTTRDSGRLATAMEAAGGRTRGGRGAGIGDDERDDDDVGRQGAAGGWRFRPQTQPPGSAAGVGSDGNETAASTIITKPNVFFFLIDDMGYGDIGYQSTDLSELTPNLDNLAAGGVKLTKYYTMSLCTPARASVLTGRYPVRYGMQHGIIFPEAPWGLPLNEKILPQYMNEAGYESHMVGKWHLGSHKQAALPNQRGFKSFLGYLNGIDTYYSHKNPEVEVDGRHFFDMGYGNATGYHCVSQGAMCSDGRGGPSWDDDSRDLLDPADVCYTGTYSTDVFLGRARQIVQGKTPFDEEPLFLYLAHQSVHAPTGPAPWEAFSQEERNLLDSVRKKTGSDKRARFAGVLKFLDKRIGAFMDMLEQEGWLENSVIVVASDNGACHSDGGTNYPLRGGKQSVYEGGTKVPAFVWSNSHLPSEARGTSYDKLMHSTDWLPTLASLAGAELSGSAGDLDGVDQWESIASNAVRMTEAGSIDPRTEMLYNWDSYLLSSTNGLKENRNLTQGAFRSGDWKLLVNVFCSGYYSHDAVVVEHDELIDPEVTCSGAGECQDCLDQCQFSPDSYAISNKLFNLRDDPREEHDLSHHYPEIVQRLRRRAERVAYSGWASSNLKTIDAGSYDIWMENHWWMLPWEEILQDDTVVTTAAVVDFGE